MNQQKPVQITDVLYREVVHEGVTLYITSCLPHKLRHLYVLLGSAKQAKNSYFPFVCIAVHNASLKQLERIGFDADAFLAGKEGRV